MSYTTLIFEVIIILDNDEHRLIRTSVADLEEFIYELKCLNIIDAVDDPCISKVFNKMSRLIEPSSLSKYLTNGHSCGSIGEEFDANSINDIALTWKIYNELPTVSQYEQIELSADDITLFLNKCTKYPAVMTSKVFMKFIWKCQEVNHENIVHNHMSTNPDEVQHLRSIECSENSRHQMSILMESLDTNIITIARGDKLYIDVEVSSPNLTLIWKWRIENKCDINFGLLVCKYIEQRNIENANKDKLNPTVLLNKYLLDSNDLRIDISSPLNKEEYKENNNESLNDDFTKNIRVLQKLSRVTSSGQFSSDTDRSSMSITSISDIFSSSLNNDSSVHPAYYWSQGSFKYPDNDGGSDDECAKYLVRFVFDNSFNNFIGKNIEFACDVVDEKIIHAAEQVAIDRDMKLRDNFRTKLFDEIVNCRCIEIAADGPWVIHSLANSNSSYNCHNNLNKSGDSIESYHIVDIQEGTSIEPIEDFSPIMSALKQCREKRGLLETLAHTDARAPEYVFKPFDDDDDDDDFMDRLLAAVDLEIKELQDAADVFESGSFN